MSLVIGYLSFFAKEEIAAALVSNRCTIGFLNAIIKIL